MARTVWVQNKQTNTKWEVEAGSELHERLKADADHVECAAPATEDLTKLPVEELRKRAADKAKALPFVTIPDDAKPEQLVAFLKN